MRYKEEFPDFDHEIPVETLTGWGFEDISWRNDSCPSFECDVFRLYVDYKDKQQREHPALSLYCMWDEDNFVLETDSFEDVRAFCEDGKRDFEPYAYDEDAALKAAWGEA